MNNYDITKIKDHEVFQQAVTTYGEDLMTRQFELERFAGEVGEDKFIRNAERMQAEGHFHENRAGRTVINTLFDPFRDAIKENLEYRGRGARAAWKNLLDGSGYLDAADISQIALNTIFSLLSRSGGDPVDQQVMSRKIMDNIKTEIITRDFAKQEPQAAEQYMAKANQRQETIRGMKRDIRAMAQSRAVLREPAGFSRSANVIAAGVALLHILDQACPETLDLSGPSYDGRKDRRHVTVSIHEVLAEKIAEGIMRIGANMFASLPLLVPPMDWGQGNIAMGGYYTTYVRNYPMVKKSRKLYNIEVQNTRGLDNTSEALNAMQRTGWKINTRVLDAMIWLFNHPEQMINGFVRAEIPIKPHFDPTYFEENTQECKTILYKWITQEKADRSVRLQTYALLEVTEKYRNEERFYFAWDMDSRGRAYPITSALSPQGSDWNKHLMHFADGQVIDKDTDMDGIRFAAATSMGHDKLPVDERIQWTKDNIAELVAVGNDPMGNLLWTEADEPAAFLAACIELADYAEQGLGFVSRMPVAVDATCSGLQVLSALSRDAVGGKMVNLTDVPERFDIYGEVAEGPFRRRLEEIAGGNLGAYKDLENAQEMARAGLEFGFDRKLVKRVVMTVPYAATKDSCRRYIREYYHDRMKVEGSPYVRFNFFVGFMADLVWDSIPEVVVRGLEVMKWIQDVSAAAIKSNPNSPLQWETPDGFVGRTNRPKESLLKPSIYIYNFRRRKAVDLDVKRVDLTTKQWLDEEDVRQHRNSCAPNFVHSLDATHLRAVVRRWAKIVSLRGQSPEFSMIHDSFAVGTRDFREFSSVIREEFVKMYEKNDLLADYELCMRELAGPDVVFPPRPAMGDLDIRSTLQSEFFFS